MSGILGTAVTGAGAVSYTIDKSLRFRKSATAYLSRTFTSTGNRKTWTFSVWLKKTRNGEGYEIFGSDYGDPYTNGYMHFDYQSSPADALNSDIGPEGTRVQSNSSNIYRDPSSWYHVVIAFDTTQATASNRIKYYVNGVQTTQTGNFPAQNFEGLVNTAGGHSIGYRMRDNDRYFDGYMAEIYFVDGQALTPSSFGETNSSTGVWQPKAYTGTYGTNGFYLKFTDVATTSGSNAGLGKDFSGNGNYWNTNNISVTAGTTYDSMKDSPTNTSATVANYCTFNPLNATVQTLGAQVLDVSQANLYAGLRNTILMGTMGGRATGKYYWEITLGNSEFVVGIATPQINLNDSYPRYVGQGPYGWGYGPSNGYCYHNGSLVTATGVTATTGDVIGIAIDLANQKMFVSKNGTWMNSGNPETGAGAVFTNISNTDYVIPCFSDGGGASAQYGYFNAGQRPFSYTAPTGYVCLNSNNLPTPTIGTSATTQANRYFDAVAYTGDGSTSRTVSGYNFQPDFVWAKSRSSSDSNNLADSVRGFSVRLFSNLTNAEESNTYLGTTAINGVVSNGFTTGSNSNVNANGTTYVGWCWKANGSGSSNTAGSITSTVNANTTAGFSIVTWTGVGGSGTVGHGLGVAPKIIIDMPRSFVSDKYVYNSNLGATNYLSINLNAGSGSTTLWNNTAPTSTVFSVNGGGSNGSGSTYVAYCFAEIAGFSKFGSYTGNGSTEGPFIYCGFRPRWIMIKRTDASGSDWVIYDAARNTYNLTNTGLSASLADAESAYAGLDFVSNGFKLRATQLGVNTNGGNYVYMVFAETPFNYSLAR